MANSAPESHQNNYTEGKAHSAPESHQNNYSMQNAKHTPLQNHITVEYNYAEVKTHSTPESSLNGSQIASRMHRIFSFRFKACFKNNCGGMVGIEDKLNFRMTLEYIGYFTLLTIQPRNLNFFVYCK